MCPMSLVSGTIGSRRHHAKQSARCSVRTDDKVYCVYVASDEHAVRAHAQKGGFPADVIARVHSVIDTTTAEAGTA